MKKKNNDDSSLKKKEIKTQIKQKKKMNERMIEGPGGSGYTR